MGKWRLLALGGLMGLAIVASGLSEARERLAPYELQYLAQHVLLALGADSEEISIYETSGISHSTVDCIRINHARNKLGPAEFVIAHECGHVAACHCHMGTEGETKEESRAIEKEADLLGAQALHELGLDRVILERIADLRMYAADEGVCENDDHPSLVENAEYLTEYLIEIGYTREYIDDYCSKLIPMRESELEELEGGL